LRWLVLTFGSITGEVCTSHISQPSAPPVVGHPGSSSMATGMNTLAIHHPGILPEPLRQVVIPWRHLNCLQITDRRWQDLPSPPISAYSPGHPDAFCSLPYCLLGRLVGSRARGRKYRSSPYNRRATTGMPVLSDTHCPPTRPRSFPFIQLCFFSNTRFIFAYGKRITREETMRHWGPTELGKSMIWNGMEPFNIFIPLFLVRFKHQLEPWLSF